MLRMNTSSILMGLTLVCLLCIGWMRVESRTTGESWEYKVLEVNTSNLMEFEKTLNQQGMDRWELAAGEPSSGWRTFVFKRLK